MKGTTIDVEETLLPCWSWKEASGLYSGKHKTNGHNIRVVAISDPLPRSTHDKKACQEKQHFRRYPPLCSSIPLERVFTTSRRL